MQDFNKTLRYPLLQSAENSFGKSRIIAILSISSMICLDISRRYLKGDCSLSAMPIRLYHVYRLPLSAYNVAAPSETHVEARSVTPRKSLTDIPHAAGCARRRCGMSFSQPRELSAWKIFLNRPTMPKWVGGSRAVKGNRAEASMMKMYVTKCRKRARARKFRADICREDAS